jgi:hypothetical protein
VLEPPRKLVVIYSYDHGSRPRYLAGCGSGLVNGAGLLGALLGGGGVIGSPVGGTGSSSGLSHGVVLLNFLTLYTRILVASPAYATPFYRCRVNFPRQLFLSPAPAATRSCEGGNSPHCTTKPSGVHFHLSSLTGTLAF